MRTFPVFCAGLGVLVASPVQSAEKVCDRHDRIVQSLTDRYDEAAASIGLDSEGNLFEVFTSDRGSWTVLVTNPKGVACVLAVGEAWDQVGLPPAI